MDTISGKKLSLCEINCKRNSVIASAANLFLEHGYHGTSISDIAKNSQVDKSSIYYYFRDKPDIAYSVFNNISTFYNNRLFDPCRSKIKVLQKRSLSIKFIDDLNNLIDQGHIWLLLAYDAGFAGLPELENCINNHIDEWHNFMLNFVSPSEQNSMNEKMAAQMGFELIIASMQINLRRRYTNSSKFCLKKLLKSLWLQ